MTLLTAPPCPYVDKVPCAREAQIPPVLSPDHSRRIRLTRARDIGDTSPPHSPPIPPPGVFMTKPDKTYKGQNYWSGTSRPYTRRDGTPITLIEWNSHCVECGRLFSLWRPAKRAKFDPNRRCEEYKRPGCRVIPILTLSDPRSPSRALR
jgi:hypothetical protein